MSELASEVLEEPVAEEITAFEFDDDFQTKVAALSMRDPSFVRRCEGLIEPGHFENPHEAVLFKMASEYWAKYRSLPSTKTVWVEMLKDAKADKVIRDDAWTEVIEAFKRAMTTSLRDAEYAVDKVSEFARHQAIQKAMMDSIELTENGRFDDAQAKLESAFRVGAADTFVDIDYWNSVDGRTDYRKDVASGLIKPQGVPTGIKKFDNLLYHKGWGRKELSCIMAGAKRGKSTALGEFSLRAAMQGFNVLYVTLEVATSIIADRMDANVSDTAIGELTDRIFDVDTKVKAKYDPKTMGALRLTEFPSGTLTPSQLRRVIEKYKADGIVFDLIAVDYADIMAPDMRTSDPIENSKQVWLGLRAIAFEENAAVLTATQTNREGYKQSVAKAEHAAEDFNKVRIVDLMITVNKTDEEIAKGEARLFFAASRNQAGEYSVHIKQDMEKMKFVTDVARIE